MTCGRSWFMVRTNTNVDSQNSFCRLSVPTICTCTASRAYFFDRMRGSRIIKNQPRLLEMRCIRKLTWYVFVPVRTVKIMIHACVWAIIKWGRYGWSPYQFRFSFSKDEACVFVSALTNKRTNIHHTNDTYTVNHCVGIGLQG